MLNQCIYQWASLQKSQGLVAEILKLANTPLFSGLDVDAITRTCEEQLEHTENLVDGSELSQNLDSVISAAKGKLASGCVSRAALEHLKDVVDSVPAPAWRVRSGPGWALGGRPHRAPPPPRLGLADLGPRKSSDQCWEKSRKTMYNGNYVSFCRPHPSHPRDPVMYSC